MIFCSGICSREEICLQPQAPFHPVARSKEWSLLLFYHDFRKILWDVNISDPAADSNSFNAICNSALLDRLLNVDDVGRTDYVNMIISQNTVHSE